MNYGYSFDVNQIRVTYDGVGVLVFDTVRRTSRYYTPEELAQCKVFGGDAELVKVFLTVNGLCTCYYVYHIGQIHRLAYEDGNGFLFKLNEDGQWVFVGVVFARPEHTVREAVLRFPYSFASECYDPVERTRVNGVYKHGHRLIADPHLGGLVGWRISWQVIQDFICYSDIVTSDETLAQALVI